MWIYRQATDVLVKCIDVELLSDPQALTQYCLHPSEQRLNPLEFHGKRRSAAKVAPASTSAAGSRQPPGRQSHDDPPTLVRRVRDVHAGETS
jgi:hypothetical protein